MQRDRKIGLISFSKSGLPFVELENEVTTIDGLMSEALRFARPQEPTLMVRAITRIKTPARMPSMLPQKLWDCDHYLNVEPRKDWRPVRESCRRRERDAIHVIQGNFAASLREQLCFNNQVGTVH